MRNLRLEIEYDGNNYCGWQVQNRPKTKGRNTKKKAIQEVIEKVLRKILREKVQLAASGRTDAGVSAQAQVANFLTTSKIPASNLQKALNALLPPDISIAKIEDVSLDFHSRFSAKSKTYRYSILNRAYPSALLRNKVYFYAHPLDFTAMRSAAKSLVGRHDFSAYCASASRVKSKIRTIKNLSLKKRNNGLIEIDVESNGFLYNMVRNIVGTLIEVGRHKLKIGAMKKILASGDRRLAGPTAPAKGLSLIEVKY